jgi:hypothetical protein
VGEVRVPKQRKPPPAQPTAASSHDPPGTWSITPILAPIGGSEPQLPKQVPPTPEAERPIKMCWSPKDRHHEGVVPQVVEVLQSALSLVSGGVIHGHWSQNPTSNPLLTVP